MSIHINPISPVAFSVFGLDIRWYALAYVVAFVVGFVLFRKMVNDKKSVLDLTKKQFDDLFTAVVLGVIIGGRLGYVLFYNLPYFLKYPLEIFAVWNGGMSFHGGMLGVFGAVIIFSWLMDRKRKDNRVGTWNVTWKIMDLIAVVAPIGLFFGRIANFINMEVMGRVTDKPWGVIFNGYEPIPRHASPLYEAMLEGVLLFIIMYCLYKYTGLRKRFGALSGVFVMGYAVFRVFCEFFRAPDAHIGFLTGWGLTMGQLLSGLMFIAGAIIFGLAFRKK
ncbi:prolipoprotein diacylglyceryl transferase [Lachnospiraceae bacterium OttesenSCG-928-E19]|nr:prolipoprotein diacylglyceryl transferase [Lachnospiraceae bacterium OttesenSCG-928-E19]